jgi:Zn-dependent alcohol dehydrogenase
MKAAVCYEFGTPLSVEEVEIDPPRTGEVKVRMVAVAICHSDIHYIRGDWKAEVPIVVGHEAAGIVDAVGEGVTHVAPGDPVVVSLLRSCGRCFYCATGASYLCNGTFALDTESRLRNQQGVPLRHGLGTAAFAEYAVVDQSQVVPVPVDLPLECAALLACCVITGVGAVVNTAQVAPGSSVVIIGAGGVGLNAIQGALLAGATPIIALDMLEAKLQAARAFGATHTLNAGQPDMRRAIKEIIGGRGADYVFVTVGSAEAAAQGLRLIRAGGTLVIVGIPRQEATMPLRVYDVAWIAQTIKGSVMGSARLSVDVPRLVRLYRQGRLKLDELITARYPLERINEAIAVAERGETIRNVIVFGPEA